MGHRLDGVLDEVQQGLLEALLVELDLGDLGELLDELDARLLELELEEPGDLADHVVQVADLQAPLGRADSHEVVDDDHVEPVDLFAHDVQVGLEVGGPDAVGVPELLLHELQVDADRRKRVLDLMGHARREGRQRGKALGPAQPRLPAPPLRDVFDGQQAPVDLAAAHERQDRDRYGARRRLLESEVVLGDALLLFEAVPDELRDFPVTDRFPDRPLHEVPVIQRHKALRGLVRQQDPVVLIEHDDPFGDRVHHHVGQLVLGRERLDQAPDALRVELLQLGKRPLHKALHAAALIR